eukprot:evm.model.scf_2223.1 EVM.evm.TU.scf_2223.1   scf_2223:5351-6311(-)
MLAPGHMAVECDQVDGFYSCILMRYCEYCRDSSLKFSWAHSMDAFMGNFCFAHAKIDSSNVQEAERKPPGMLDQVKDQLQVLSLQSLGSMEAPDDAMEAIAEGEGTSDLQPRSEADTSWAKGLQMSAQESPGQ